MLEQRSHRPWQAVVVLVMAKALPEVAYLVEVLVMEHTVEALDVKDQEVEDRQEVVVHPVVVPLEVVQLKAATAQDAPEEDPI